MARNATKSLRRNMGGVSKEEAVADTENWIKYSIGMMGLTGVLSVYVAMVNEHGHGRRDLPYSQIRTKPYPWRECPNCELLDANCWKKCRGEEVEDEHH